MTCVFPSVYSVTKHGVKTIFSSYKFFTLVWIVYQVTKLSKYDKGIICMLTRGDERMVGNDICGMNACQ